MTDGDLEGFLAAAAPLLGLTITAEQRPGVLGFLAVARAMAALVEAAPVPADHLDLAPVFTPGERRS